MGRVVLFSSYPEAALVTMAMHQETGRSLLECERAVFDVDHCMIGGLFFGKWGMPAA